MPLASWGQGGDPSSYFASLVSGMEDQVRTDAQRLDQRHEEALAAHDSDVFARYQAGQLSNREWLAYIRRRKAETAYDPSQHADWVKADLEWSENIADTEAQADFERTKDYGAYIGYLNDKLDSTKDSAGRLQIQQQIRSLTDEHQQQTWVRGAQRIYNQITLGKATPDDLLRFAREQRRGLRSGSPLRETIEKAIADTTATIRANKFVADMAAVDVQLQQGGLTPAQAAKQKKALLAGSNLQQTNPTQYYSLLDEANKLQYSPDPAKLAQLQFQLQTGDLTPDQYQQKLYGMADLLMDYDPAAAWSLRSDAFNAAQAAQSDLDKNKLPNPGALNGYTASAGDPGGFRWMSQMDGSQYQSLNCTMASGAMIAYAMGYKGLSGGDLRYLTGDTVQGTNIDQLYAALGKAGVDTSGMALNRSGDFEKFKQMVANGRPSVIVGSNANIPASAKAAEWMQGKHAWMVAEYDPKKDAFHIFNSAMSRSDPRSKNGYWVSSDIMQSFGFGPGVSGQWLAAPKGTAKSVGKAWHVIDVDTEPQRPNTPKSYKGLNNPGASGNQKGAVRSKGGAKPLPENPTIQDVKDRQLADQKRLDQLDDIQTNDPTISPWMQKEIDAERMRIYDENIHYSQSMDDYSGAGQWRNAQADFIAKAKERNGARVEEMFNTLVRNAAADLDGLQYVSDPGERASIIAGIAKRLDTFNNTKVVADPEDPLSGPDPETDAKIQAITDAMNTAADPTVPLDQKKDAIDQLLTAVGGKAPGQWNDPNSTAKGDDLGTLITNVAGVADDKYAVDNGEGEPVVVTRPDGSSRIEIVKYIDGERWDPATGGKIVEPVLDTSKLGDGTVGDQLPRVIVQTPTGPKAIPAVVVQKESGLNKVQVLKKFKDANGVEHDKGEWLTNTDLAALTPQDHQKFIDQGLIKDQPWMVDSITMPDVVGKDGVRLAGATYVRDPGTRKWAMEHLPIVGVSGQDIPGVPNLVGVGPDGEPQVEYEPQAHQLEWDMPQAPNVNGKQAQAKLDSGEWDQYKTGIYRDDNGMTTDLATYDDSARKYTPPTMSEREWTAGVRLYQYERQTAAVKAAQQAEAAAQAANAARITDQMPLTDSSPVGQFGGPTVDLSVPGGSPMGALPQLASLFPSGQLQKLATSFGVKTTSPAQSSVPSPTPTPSQGRIPENTKDPNLPKLDPVRPAPPVRTDAPTPPKRINDLPRIQSNRTPRQQQDIQRDSGHNNQSNSNRSPIHSTPQPVRTPRQPARFVPPSPPKKKPTYTAPGPRRE